MHPPEEFLKHAAECQLTAKLARDPASKAAWSLGFNVLNWRNAKASRHATPPPWGDPADPPLLGVIFES